MITPFNRFRRLVLAAVLALAGGCGGCGDDPSASKPSPSADAGSDAAPPACPQPTNPKSTCLYAAFDEALGACRLAPSWQPFGNCWSDLQIDPSTSLPFAEQIAFLVDAPTSVQFGLEPGRLDAARVAVVTGTLVGSSGPLWGASVQERDTTYGTSQTEYPTGRFFFVVNAGSPLRLRFGHDGHLPAERVANPEPGEYLSLGTVELVPEPELSPVQPGAAAWQVVETAENTDTYRSKPAPRAAKIFVPPNTQWLGADGKPLSGALTVGAKEYTVGDGAAGARRMPAELPPTSAYTYAAELVARIDGKAVDPSFSQPVYVLLENFLDFPVGATIPSGVYDWKGGAWSQLRADGGSAVSGKVIAILSVSGGVAQVDTTGDGVADDTGLSLGERQTLAAHCGPGSYWRMPVLHFSTWDFNLGWVPPADAKAPPNPEGDPLGELGPSCRFSGTVIECENRVLGEEIPIPNTPYFLAYRSSRTRGYKPAYDLKFKLPGGGKPALPDSAKKLIAQLTIAGVTIEQEKSKPAGGWSTDEHVAFEWDGKDAFGRDLNGEQIGSVKLGAVYSGVYGDSTDFALPPVGQYKTNPTKQEVTFWTTAKFPLGTLNAVAMGFGGWTLSHQHVYDRSRQTIHYGWGGFRRADALGQSLTAIAPCECPTPPCAACDVGSPRGMDFANDGALYYASKNEGEIRKVAGATLSVFHSGLSSPVDVRAAPDGSLIVVEEGAHRVVRLKDGVVTPLVGTGQAGSGPDQGPATSIALSFPSAVAVAADGTLFVSDTNNRKIRRVAPDGTLTTYAGTGQTGWEGDGGKALDANLVGPRGLDVAPDGSLIFADVQGLLTHVRRIDPGGVIHLLAGGGKNPLTEGISAQDAQVQTVSKLRVAKDGTIYYAEGIGANPNVGHRVRKINASGLVTTIAGDGQIGACKEGAALSVHLQIPEGLAFANDGSLWVSMFGLSGSGCIAIRRIAPPVLGGIVGNVFVPSEDGSEIYEFNDLGRHVATRDAALGLLRFQLAYGDFPDATGRKRPLLTELRDLRGATDGVGLVTKIVRGPSGEVQRVDPPYAAGGSLSTQLTLAGDWLASVVAPGSTWSYGVSHQSNGLLTQVVAPKGTHAFTYDPEGRLLTDRDPKTPAPAAPYRAVSAFGDPDVKITTATGLVHRFKREKPADGFVTQRVTRPDTTVVEATMHALSGARVATYADGSTRTALAKPDPRFGMAAATTEETLTLPDSKELIVSVERTVAGAVAGSPFSHDKLEEIRTVYGGAGQSPHAVLRSELSGPTGAKLLRTTSAAGRKQMSALDAQGRVVSSQFDAPSPEAAAVQYEWDEKGRLSRITQGTRRTRFDYDPTTGRLTRVAQGTPTDELMLTTTTAHDAAGRATSVTAHDGSVTGFGWDGLTNLIRFETPNAAGSPFVHLLPHDSVDLLTAYDPPNVTGVPADTVKYSYDLDRRLTRIDHADGRALQFDYAPVQGTLTHVRDKAGAQLRSFNYSTTTGLMESASAGSGANAIIQSFGYAAHGALPDRVSTLWPTGGQKDVGFGYDAVLRVTQEAVTGGATLTYTLDKDDLVTTIQSGSPAFTLNLSQRSFQSGRLNGLLFGALIQSRSYDTTYGDLTGIATKQGITNRYAFALTHDALGRIASKTETAGASPAVATSYTYDAVGRLSSATRAGITTSWQYDARGNRTHEDGQAVATFDAQDRLLTHGTGATQATFTHDADGRRTSRTLGGVTTSYAWDDFGRLKSVTTGPTTIEYLHDAFGRRVTRRKLVSGALQAEERYLYAEDQRITATLDATGAVTARFVYGSGTHIPDVILKSGQVHLVTTDHLGSIRAVINSTTGTTVQSLEHDAWGTVLADTAPGFQPFGFAGGLYDPDTKLVHFGAREYDPQTGRWLTKDPAGVEGGTNLYEYAASDPVNLQDIDGESPVLWLVASPVGRAALGAGVGFISGGAFDIAAQLALNGGQLDCVDWGRVKTAAEMSAVMGALSGGLGGIGGRGADMSWRAVRARLGKELSLEPGTQVHHWLIPQGGWGKFVPDAIKNARWNLMVPPAHARGPVWSAIWHQGIHGKNPVPLGLGGRLWHGSPTWAKGAAAAVPVAAGGIAAVLED